MRMLGRDYGVIPIFRRLCGKALGGKAKSELRNWRMASLLNSVEGHGNITQLALIMVTHRLHIFSKVRIKELIGAFRRIIKYYSNWQTNEDTYSSFDWKIALACAALWFWLRTDLFW